MLLWCCQSVLHVWFSSACSWPTDKLTAADQCDFRSSFEHVITLFDTECAMQTLQSGCVDRERRISSTVQPRDVNSWDPKAQIPGLVWVSIWTVFIRLAKQWQRVHGGPSPAGGFTDPATGCVGRKKALPPAALAPSRAAASPQGMQLRRRVAVVSRWRCINCCCVSIECCPAPASMTRQRPPLRGWSEDGVPSVVMLLSTVMLHLCSIGRLKLPTFMPPARTFFVGV